jgi:hypothetical protein
MRGWKCDRNVDHIKMETLWVQLSGGGSLLSKKLSFQLEFFGETEDQEINLEIILSGLRF